MKVTQRGKLQPVNRGARGVRERMAVPGLPVPHENRTWRACPIVDLDGRHVVALQLPTLGAGICVAQQATEGLRELPPT